MRSLRLAFAKKHIMQNNLKLGFKLFSSTLLLCFIGKRFFNVILVYSHNYEMLHLEIVLFRFVSREYRVYVLKFFKVCTFILDSYSYLLGTVENRDGNKLSVKFCNGAR